MTGKKEQKGIRVNESEEGRESKSVSKLTNVSIFCGGRRLSDSFN